MHFMFLTEVFMKQVTENNYLSFCNNEHRIVHPCKETGAGLQDSCASTESIQLQDAILMAAACTGFWSPFGLCTIICCCCCCNLCILTPLRRMVPNMSQHLPSHSEAQPRRFHPHQCSIQCFLHTKLKCGALFLNPSTFSTSPTL